MMGLLIFGLLYILGWRMIHGTVARGHAHARLGKLMQVDGPHRPSRELRRRLKASRRGF